MFERSLLDSSSPRKTMPLAYLLELALVGLLVLAPLLNTRALTVNELRTIWTKILPPPPLGHPPGQRQARQAGVERHVPTPDKLQVPPVIPNFIGKYVDASSPPPQPEIGVTGGINLGPAGRGDGVMPSILTGRTLPPPPPLAAAKAHGPVQIRQGGRVVAAKAIYQPTPDYPPLAQRARVEGVVRLEAVIATDGTIQNLRALSGHPLLVGAALEAVSRWRYQPTLLNGEPVEVLTEIDVTFKLAE